MKKLFLSKTVVDADKKYSWLKMKRRLVFSQRKYDIKAILAPFIPIRRYKTKNKKKTSEGAPNERPTANKKKNLHSEIYTTNNIRI